MEARTTKGRAFTTVLATALALCASLMLAATSFGAVTIGSNLTAPADISFQCRMFGVTSCTLQNNMLGSPYVAPSGLVSPIDGVITTWRVKTGCNATDCPPQVGGPFSSPPIGVALQVLVPAGAGFIGGPSSSTVTLSGAVDFIQETPTSVPIQAGQAIGLNLLPNGSVDPGNDQVFVTSVGTGNYIEYDPAVSQGSTATFAADESDQALFNATIDEAPTLSVRGVPSGCTSGFKARISVTDDASLTKKVRVKLDGHTIAKAKKKKFSVTVSSAGLSLGRHTLSVTATDSAGQTATKTKRFSVCRAPGFTG